MGITHFNFNKQYLPYQNNTLYVNFVHNYYVLLLNKFFHYDQQKNLIKQNSHLIPSLILLFHKKDVLQEFYPFFSTPNFLILQKYYNILHHIYHHNNLKTTLYLYNTNHQYLTNSKNQVLHEYIIHLHTQHIYSK